MRQFRKASPSAPTRVVVFAVGGGGGELESEEEEESRRKGFSHSFSRAVV